MKTKLLILSVLGVSLGLGILQAATIAEVSVTKYSTTGTTSVDISSLGTTDWSYWDAGSGTFPNGGAATNDKLNGSMIGTPTLLGGGGTAYLSGAGTGSMTDFSYVGGTGPSSGTASGVTGILNSDLATVGAGVQLAIDLPSTDEYTVYLWLAAFNTGSTEGNTDLSISLAGADTYQSSSVLSGAYTVVTYLYEMTVQADTMGDDLTISLINNSTNNYSNVRLLGAAVAAVPETSTYAFLFGLISLGLVIFLKFRKR